MWGRGTFCRVGVACLAVTGCWSEPRIDGQFTEEEWAFLQTFKLPDPELCPDSFAGSRCAAAAVLGKHLFFDTELSGEITTDLATEPYAPGRPCDVGKVSCASCHDSTQFFTDTRSPGQISIGTGYTRRNALGLVNTGYKAIVARASCPHPDPSGYCESVYSWNGQYATPGDVLALALHKAMNSDENRLACVVARNHSAEYVGLFGAPPCAVVPPDGRCSQPSPQCAAPGPMLESLGGTDEPRRVEGGGDPAGSAGGAGVLPRGIPEHPFVEPPACDPTDQVVKNVVASFDAYERRLIRVNSPFDRYIAGDRAAMGDDARRGLALFIGKAMCVDCHQPPLLSDLKFHNIGVPQRGLRAARTDCGLYESLSALPCGADRALAGYAGEFLTQPLRNVAQTAPYMHAGQLASLADVIEFYRRGGEREGYAGVKDPRIEPLDLDDDEARALEAFLRALTSGDALPHSLTDPGTD